MCFVGLVLSLLYCSQDVREAGDLLWLIEFVGRGFFFLVGYGLIFFLEVMVEGLKSDEPGVLFYVAEELQY